MSERTKVTSSGQRASTTLLDVRGIRIRVLDDRGYRDVVHGVSFSVDRGEIVGLVGESGSGKSLSALSIVGALPASTSAVGGEIVWQGRTLAGRAAKGSRFADVRGTDIGMVMQEPKASLNPLLAVGDQLLEVVRRHQHYTREVARRKMLELLEAVEIPNPAERARQYPRELSGGMCQRVAIAMALAGEPQLLIADEPTTALDVTVQAQVLDLLLGIRERFGVAVLLITHDLGVVSEVCDRVIVMYGGHVMETASKSAFFRRPLSPYSRGLLDAMPSWGPSSGGSLKAIPGSPESSRSHRERCPFAPRCDSYTQTCGEQLPVLREMTTERNVACHNPEAIS